MSTNGASSSLKNTPEQRLLRYLYIGKEYPLYQAGNWFVHKYYEEDKIPSIKDLAGDSEKQTLPVELILKAHEQAVYIQNPETLVFALTVCSKQNISEKLRTAAYSALNKVCNSPQYFLLFVKFRNQLSQKVPEGNHGYGHGWRKAVSKWYTEKTPLELAKCVTQCQGRYGWKHKDVIKLCHYYPDSLAREVVLKYILYGFETAKQHADKHDSDENIDQILSYIKTIEDFKHCDDEVEAGQLIEQHNLNLDLVPGHLLKSIEVWTSLVETMNLSMLLVNLQRIHNLGFFKPESLILAKVLDALASKEKVMESKIQPALVLITVKNYENSGKPLSYEKRKIKMKAKRPLQQPHKPNKDLITCLYKTLDMSFVNIQPTNLRYLIIVNVNEASLQNPTWHNDNVNVAEAVCMIASSLRPMKNVTLCAPTFITGAYCTVPIHEASSFKETLLQIHSCENFSVIFDHPILWAAVGSKEFDFFINIFDVNEKTSQHLKKCEEGIKFYRNKMNIPKARLVNCAMCASSTYLNKEKYDENILNICGFDANVPKLIEAFSKFLF